MTESFINVADIDAYRTWRQRRTGPAYPRGVPTWVWRSALTRRRTLTVT
jgi:hypothetical protein